MVVSWWFPNALVAACDKQDIFGAKNIGWYIQLLLVASYIGVYLGSVNKSSMTVELQLQKTLMLLLQSSKPSSEYYPPSMALQLYHRSPTVAGCTAAAHLGWWWSSQCRGRP